MSQAKATDYDEFRRQALEREELPAGLTGRCSRREILRLDFRSSEEGPAQLCADTFFDKLHPLQLALLSQNAQPHRAKASTETRARQK
ncbi:MAG TPA: hypothetical protein VKV77_12410 [Methylovirgula sp.]|nr:hypothetical protein [Methylovirgula sp.]